MRPYRIEDEALDDDEYPRVVPVAHRDRTRPSSFVAGLRHRPWTPRETGQPPAAPRPPRSPLTMQQSGLSRTHQLMIASFAIICIGMILGIAMVRVWDEANQAVASLPPDVNAAPARPAVEPTAPPAAEPAAEPTPPQAGAITTEIRVLEPNYTVAPGDTLGIIARRHGSTVEALASINNLENRNSLRVGQKLIIP